MGADVDAALADALARLEEGRPLTLDWLQRSCPREWEEVHQSLALAARLGADAAFDPDACAGAEVGGWRLEAVVGAGAFGTVFRARRGGEVAGVKVLHPELATRRGGPRRFLREARLGALVDDPHVVRVLGADTCELKGFRTVWLAMELVEGATLAEILGAEGPRSDAECRDIGRQVARGLAAIHEAGAVHRDLKPHNVLRAADGTVKLFDLGVAWAGDEIEGGAGAFAGTLRYAAPEQLAGDGDGPPDPRGDLYGLGALLFELATGEPYRAAATAGDAVVEATRAAGPDVRERMPATSRFLAAAVRTLVAPRPQDRFASAAEAADVLARGESGPWWRTAGRAPAPASGLPPLLEAARRTPFVGRERELSALLAALDRVDRGPVAVLVEGDDGIGKSRIVAELAARARDRGLGVVAVPAAGEERPGRALLRALDASGDGDPVEEIRARAEGAGLVVVLEDLDETARPARALFSRLAAGPAGGLLLVGTLRPPGNDPWAVHATAVAGAEELPLARLSDDDARTLLAGVLGPDALGPEEADRVVAAARGLPLALLAAARRHAARSGPAVSVTRVATTSAADVPRAILDAVKADLDATTPADARLLAAAACCGPRFTADDVAVAAARDPAAVRADLARLAVGSAFLEPRDAAFAFLHPLVRRAVHALAPVDVRRGAHRALAARWADGAGGIAGLRGRALVGALRHLLEADEPERVAPYVSGAVAFLRDEGTPGETVDLCRRALAFDTLARGQVGAQVVRYLGDAAERAGDHETAREASERAMAIAREVGDPHLAAFCRSGAIGILVNAERSAEAEPIAREMERLAVRHGDLKAHLHALRWQARIAQVRGDVATVRACHEKFDEVAARPEALRAEPRAPIYSADQWALLAWYEGRHDDEARHVAEGLRLAEAAGDTHAARTFRREGLRCAFWSGRLREAEAGYRAIFDEARGRHMVYAAQHQAFLGQIRALCGDRPAAEQAFDSAAAVFRRTGSVTKLLGCLLDRADLESRLGDARAAYGRARRTLRLVRQCESAVVRGWSRKVVAVIARRGGFHASAGRLVRRAEAALATTGRAGLHAEARVWRLLIEGDAAAAGRLFRAELDRVPWFGRRVLADAIRRETGTAADLALARELARGFLGQCPEDLVDVARRHAPEIRDPLGA